MKALEILGRLSLNMCVANPMERIAISGTDVYEAIAELKALQSRSCEGCKYLEQKFHHISPRCVVHEYLLTNYSKKVFCCSRYEPKEQ